MREQIQNEAVKIALENKCGTLDLSVRSGKTLVGLTISENFDKVLVSYPNISIKNSWLSDAQKFGKNLSGVEFTTHLSFSKQDLGLYNCILIDEIQDFSINNWEWLIQYKFQNVYGLTGTVPNGDKKKYIDKYCPVIYSVKLDETVGILQKDYEIIVHLLEPSDKKDIPLKSGKFWSEKSKIQFWDNKYNQSHNFMDMLRLIQSIQNSKTKLDYLGKLSTKIDKCLIFLETTKQCSQFAYPSHHSKEKESEKNLEDFQKGNITHLTCVKQLSAGITFHNLNECIILHAYASNNKTHQRLARTLQYAEGEKSTIHILGLKGTRDEQWITKGLSEFDQSKIKYINAV